MEEINVESIMSEIRNETAGEEAPWESVRFEDMPTEPVSSLQESFYSPQTNESNEMLALHTKWEISFFRPIPGNPVKVFVKKIIRKLIRFCVEPIAQSVTEFNMSVVHCFVSFQSFARRSKQNAQQQQCEIDALKKQVEILEQRIAELEREKT